MYIFKCKCCIEQANVRKAPCAQMAVKLLVVLISSWSMFPIPNQPWRKSFEEGAKDSPFPSALSQYRTQTIRDSLSGLVRFGLVSVFSPPHFHGRDRARPAGGRFRRWCNSQLSSRPPPAAAGTGVDTASPAIPPPGAAKPGGHQLQPPPSAASFVGGKAGAVTHDAAFPSRGALG